MPKSGSDHRLARRILAGLLAGGVGGTAVNFLWGSGPGLDNFIRYVTEPLGQVFLRLMIMVVLPLVFCSIALGVAGLGDLRKLGRIGLKTMAFFLLVTTLAVGIGLVLVNLVQPGQGLSEAVKSKLLELYKGEAEKKLGQTPTEGLGIQFFLNIVPRNPLAAAVQGDMLAVIFFALICGVGLTMIPPGRAAPVIACLEGVGDLMVAIIGLAMRLAPVGVACLIFSVTARFGFELVLKLGFFVGTAVVGMAIHLFVVLPLLVAWLGGVRPGPFFAKAQTMMLTAFTTSSSSATLPTTLTTAEQEFGIPREISGFVIPLGATMNMNGTALFEGVAVLFLAQVFGIPLGLGAQLVVTAMSVLMAVGAAGVPGGSIPLLALVLTTVGVPGEGIALIIGVDRLLDMCRTTLNVTGDLAAAIVIARSEGLLPPAHRLETTQGALPE
ncbi:MAG: Sodium:dicarboxylate symporter [Candidatus Ozemobacter sibiricus]|uniref:Sodium:dicarboxylate symporter n=1 Tax=Candidatus Ozemobacter sibiricus TaxID=2268124 RepID=A0A367ZJE8_9BACT|nr:MAG: Sodium:dicarboxylate symporter [Candidatus Ozemobacter sibiricus]